MVASSTAERLRDGANVIVVMAAQARLIAAQVAFEGRLESYRGMPLVDYPSIEAFKYAWRDVAAPLFDAFLELQDAREMLLGHLLAAVHDQCWAALGYLPVYPGGGVSPLLTLDGVLFWQDESWQGHFPSYTPAQHEDWQRLLADLPKVLGPAEP